MKDEGDNEAVGSSTAVQNLVRNLRVFAACAAVFGLLALTIWGLVKTFGLGPHPTSWLGPVALATAVVGFALLLHWARRDRSLYGLEETAHGGITPRWYVRVPVLAGYLMIAFTARLAPSWVAVLLLIPFAMAVAVIYRRENLRWPRPPLRS